MADGDRNLLGEARGCFVNPKGTGRKAAARQHPRKTRKGKLQITKVKKGVKATEHSKLLAVKPEGFAKADGKFYFMVVKKSGDALISIRAPGKENSRRQLLQISVMQAKPTGKPAVELVSNIFDKVRAGMSDSDAIGMKIKLIG